MDEYPSEEELNMISSQAIKNRRDAHNLLAYVRELWLDRSQVDVNGVQDMWTFRTGGRSGNEDLIEALRQNQVFWTACWYQSVRGGQHVFTLNYLPMGKTGFGKPK